MGFRSMLNMSKGSKDHSDDSLWRSLLMNVLYLIIWHVIFPVFSLIVAGALLHRIFHFDMNTLSKLTTYFLMPAVSFTNIFESKIGGQSLFIILGFLLVQNLALMVMSSGVARAAKFERSLSATFKNSVVLNNSGNFGLPVSQLVFHNSPLRSGVVHRKLVPDIKKQCLVRAGV
jgi:predicted permease